MSRQTSIPLLHWRQGAADQRFISQKTWAMNLMSFDHTRCASFNPMLWINLLGAGSAAIFWTLGLMNIKPAQANPSKQQVMHSVTPPPTTSYAPILSLTLREKTQEGEFPRLLTANGQIRSVAVENVPQQISTKALVQPPETSVAAIKLMVQPVDRAQAVGQPVTKGDAHLDFERSGLAGTKHTWTSSRFANAKGFSNEVGSSANASLTKSFPQGRFANADAHRLANADARRLANASLSLPASQNKCANDKTCSSPVSSETSVASRDRSNSTLAQVPYLSQTLPPLPVPSTAIPVGSNRSNSTIGQLPSLPQTSNPMAVPITAVPGVFNNYNPTVGQPTYYPQPVMLVPVPATGMPMSPTGYPQMGQPTYYPQPVMLVPVPATGMPMSPNGYPQTGQSAYYPQGVPQLQNPVGLNGYPQMGQSAYYPQSVPQLQNPVGFNSYPQMGQPAYYPQAVPPLPAPLSQNPIGFNGYPQMGQPAYYPQGAPLPQNPVGFNGYPQMGQPAYYPQAVTPQGAPLPKNPVGFNGYPQMGQSAYYPQAAQSTTPSSSMMIPVSSSSYNQTAGQSAYYPQMAPSLPVQPTPNPVGSTNYNPMLGQAPYYPQAPSPLPNAPSPNLTLPAPTPATIPGNQQSSLFPSTALTAPALRLQGAYVNVGDQSAARARLSALYPLTPQVQFGATLDVITGKNVFSDSRGEGLNINELYLAAAPFADLPNLRLVAGQLDLTSYFDRNSFAKDATTHFFNPVFQTNPALSATGLASRPTALINWGLTDNIEAKAAVFSSSRSLGDFALDGFAGEIGFRYGNAIVRGSYATDRDAGSQDGFQEIFQARRPDGSGTGPRAEDREEAYGVNAEYFFPQLNLGLFGRYGRYENRGLDRGGDTYSFGINFLDLLTKDDRLGLAYGRGLSNEQLRRENQAQLADVLELFYDFRFLPNLRLGFTLQQRNGFEDTYAGFRLKTEFDVTPRGRLTP